MRRPAVTVVHVVLALVPLACAGVLGWRWLANLQDTQLLEQARAQQVDLDQRVTMLRHALDESSNSKPVATVALPERQNLAEVLEVIENAAQESDIDSFHTATQRSATPGRQSLEIQGETGKAQELAAFVARLESAARLLVVHQLEVRAHAHGGLAFTIQIAAYHRAKGDR